MMTQFFGAERNGIGKTHRVNFRHRGDTIVLGQIVAVTTEQNKQLAGTAHGLQ